MKNKIKWITSFATVASFVCLPLASCSAPKINYINAVSTNFGGHYAFNYGKITDSANDTHIETFYQKPSEKWVNNPNFGEAVLLNQCINYKKKHSDEKVEIALSSFHFSYMAGACVDKTKPDFGKMKQMKDVEEDDNGYIRISYLLVKAAKAGIYVYAVGQIPAAYEPAMSETDNFEAYFNNHMDDLCNDGIHTVKDYLTFKRCKWTGYGEKAATDLMHLKNCTVTAYTDDDDVDHDGTVYTSSANLDAIQDDGRAGNTGGQTAIIVSDHTKLAQCFLNYTKLLTNYCEMEDSIRFRELIHSLNVSQIDTLTQNPEATIENQIVYLGSEKDKIFELYLTPLGGSAKDFDTKYNPFAKYLTDFAKADNGQPLNLVWVNSNFKDTSEYTKMFMRTIDSAFYNKRNIKNKLIFGFQTYDPSYDFVNLIEGINIGVKSINEINKTWGLHCKDLTFKYTKAGQNQYITLLNTVNFHLGANFYQSNSILVIKETANTHNSAYINFSKFISKNYIDIDELV